ncbi:unnamed protein product [Blepharisma stoltei]|uniref:Potassium channel domain-containing protein n=1 Tax=Blepharisma stoltei TaxID=1481888 RepID=A0AAU9K1T4_9CILI|nr:unnamed protein product [Blepharisma stoltei]
MNNATMEDDNTNTTQDNILIDNKKVQKLKLSFAHLTEQYKVRELLKKIDTISALCGLAAIPLEYFQNEEFRSNDFTSNHKVLTMRVFELLLTIALIFCLTIRYRVNKDLMSLRKRNQESDGLNASNFLSGLALEIAICIVFTPPGLDYTFSGHVLSGTYKYTFSDVALEIMILRMYLFLRLYGHYSKWNSNLAKDLCHKFGTDNDFIFAIKSDIKDRPYTTIGVALTGLIIIYGVAIRTVERGFTGPYMAANMDQLFNDEWLTFITMFTVGYGDFYPSTHFGRLFSTIACISGLVIISMFIVALTITSEFDKNQTLAYMGIRNKANEEKWYVSAKEVIKQALICKQSQGDPVKKLGNMIKLRQKAHSFKRQTELSSLMDITAAEMLYDLQEKLEGKIVSTKKLIGNVPSLQLKCANLHNKQLEIDKNLDQLIEQQNKIMDFIAINLEGKMLT